MNDFLSALPAIILGIIGMAIVYFLVFGLISKVTGKTIGYRGGILYKGETIADPDMLDNAAKEIRKVFDKKYKIRKQIQADFNSELEKAIRPIDLEISMIRRSPGYVPKPFRKMNEKDKNNKNASTSDLSLISLAMHYSDTQDEFDEAIENLTRRKQEIIFDIKTKYAIKLAKFAPTLNKIPESTIKDYTIINELRTLSELYKDGLISKEEFEIAKSKLLSL